MIPNLSKKDNSEKPRIKKTMINWKGRRAKVSNKKIINLKKIKIT